MRSRIFFINSLVPDSFGNVRASIGITSVSASSIISSDIISSISLLLFGETLEIGRGDSNRRPEVTQHLSSGRVVSDNLRGFKCSRSKYSGFSGEISSSSESEGARELLCTTVKSIFCGRYKRILAVPRGARHIRVETAVCSK
jgi:hypothetical protein